MSTPMPRLLEKAQAEQAGVALALVRVAIGVGATLAPRLLLRPWIGEATAGTPGAKLTGRSLGARDIALGAGAVLAKRHDGNVRGWIEAGALADTGDLVATLVAFKHLPRRSRWLVLASTVGAVAAGLLVAPCIDDDERDPTGR